MSCLRRVARRSLQGSFLFLASLLIFGSGMSDRQFAAGAESLRALPPGQVPADQRLKPLKDLDGYFPFSPPSSREQWQDRAERLRCQLQVSLGLWPMPTRTPLNPVIHGLVDREDYTVEKVYFESMPGFYVTGSLYRPKGRTGKCAGVLCPHGHWADGRFHDAGLDQVKKEIQNGAEQFEEGGRSPLQARCVQLARMGCVVFHYDMIGYADSVQISFEIAHGFAKQRPEMNTPEQWGLFSPPAESHSQAVMGLQTYNSIRSLDFLESLPDVDASRIGVTGASGGGTQTFVLSALDPRPVVAFPAVMVSTAMQGGCTCENACGLRVGTGNVEIAALFAPKPLGMTAADDWTKEMETKGFPELKKHYQLFEKPDNVMLAAALKFGHNYNMVSRLAMYGWFNKHLGLGVPEPITEKDYRRLSRDEMSVWDASHPKPSGGADFERKLLQWWTQDADQQIAAMAPKDAVSLQKYQDGVGRAVQVVLHASLPSADAIEYVESSAREQAGVRATVGLLKNAALGQELPLLTLSPPTPKAWTVVWLDPRGKAGLLQDDGSPRAEVKSLLDAGATVVGVDLLYQGEFLADGKPMELAPVVANPRQSASYTWGYNPTVFADRTQDILTAVRYVSGRGGATRRVDLVALKGAGPWAAAARALAGQAVENAAIDTDGFRFGKVQALRNPDFLPGGAKYGDLPGMLALAAPGRLWLAGEAGPALVESAYQAAGKRDQLSLFNGPEGDRGAAAVAWLLGK